MGKVLPAALCVLGILWPINVFAAEATVYTAPSPGAITHVMDKNGFACAWYEEKRKGTLQDIRNHHEGLTMDARFSGPVLRKHLAAGDLVRHECDALHYATPILKSTPTPQP